MKKLMLLFGMLVFIALGTVSCSDDDDGNGDTNYVNIIGSWKTKHTINAGSLAMPSNCNEFVKYKFNDNGTYERTTYTGELDANDPEGDNCDEDATYNGRWSYKGNDHYLIHDNSVTITDANEAEYTYVLTTSYQGTELNWYAASDYENEIDTRTVFLKQ